MSYISELVTAQPDLTLTLGSAQLTAEHLSLKLERPVLRKTCADGTPLVTVLPQADALLTVSGRVSTLSGSEGSLMHILCAAMDAGTTYSFTLRGCSFSQMHIISCALEETENSLRAGQCTVVLSGRLAETEEGA